MSRTDDPPVVRELSRPIEASAVPPEGRDVEFIATRLECDALARRLAVVKVADLAAEMRVLPLASAEGKGTWRVIGRFDSTVVQTCTVSLEPFSSRVHEEIVAIFAAHGRDSGAAVDLTIDDESPEPLDNGMIDVGELVVQHLALSLDPHPRRPGATYEGDQGAGDLGDARGGAFAALKNLREESGK